MERAMGFEPTTSTLARLRSTPELRPHYSNTVTLALEIWIKNKLNFLLGYKYML